MPVSKRTTRSSLLGAIDELHEQPTPLSEALVGNGGSTRRIRAGSSDRRRGGHRMGREAGPLGVVWFEVDR
jgi:hypothetical protein